MNNFIIQLDVWCVISQMNFGFPLMFPSICISGQMCKAIFFCQRYLLLRLFLKWVRWKTDFLHIHVMYTQLILNCYFIFADVLAYFPKLVPSVGLCECVCLQVCNCECVWMSLYMNLCITKHECESVSDCGCVKCL